MTLNDLLVKLYFEMSRSPLDTRLSIIQDRKIIFGTSNDEHIRRLLVKRPYVKRWAVYNDESEIVIELEG